MLVPVFNENEVVWRCTEIDVILQNGSIEHDWLPQRTTITKIFEKGGMFFYECADTEVYGEDLFFMNYDKCVEKVKDLHKLYMQMDSEGNPKKKKFWKPKPSGVRAPEDVTDFAAEQFFERTKNMDFRELLGKISTGELHVPKEALEFLENEKDEKD